MHFPATLSFPFYFPCLSIRNSALPSAARSSGIACLGAVDELRNWEQWVSNLMVAWVFNPILLNVLDGILFGKIGSLEESHA